MPSQSRAERRKNLERRASTALEEKLDHDLGRIFFAMKDAIEILRELKAAIEEERQLLLELYEIEATAESLQALIATHEAETTAFEQQISYVKQRWEEERKALNRARAYDEEEYRQRQNLARAKEEFDRSRIIGTQYRNSKPQMSRGWSPGLRPRLRRLYGSSKSTRS